MEAHLVVINGDDAGTVIPLVSQGRVTLGRHRTNDIVLEEEQVSRYHAEIALDHGQWVIRDHTSVNGTYVDGQKIRSAMLRDGQLIRIGPAQLRFVLGAPVGPAPATRGPDPSSDHGKLTSSLLDATPFHVDEFSALCRFMADAVDVDDARQVIVAALKTVQEVTHADVVGFLGLDDAGQLLPKIVLPEQARGDYHLSKNLTQQARATPKPVWLQAERPDRPEGELESLAGFEDAICVALGDPKDSLGAVHAYQRGRTFRGHDVHFCEIVTRHLAGTLRLIQMRKQLEEENTRLKQLGPPLSADLIGDSPVMVALRNKILLVARHLPTVLIRGETGVGKELVARALHRHSQRKHGPLVAMNCGALHRELMKSELFGHCKGAFTGATAKHLGYFGRADNGILFLDEVGELTLEAQVLLLRVLDKPSFTPVGSEVEESVDLRIISATNRNLEQAVEAKTLREDFFYRIKGVELRVPPLREHAEDIPALARHYYEHMQGKTGRAVTLTPEAEKRLQEYHWPGNVRQLWGVLESGMAFQEGNVVDVHHLDFGPAPVRPLNLSGLGDLGGLPTHNLKELEKLAIKEALTATRGNLTEAAERLGMARSTLTERVRKRGLEE